MRIHSSRYDHQGVYPFEKVKPMVQEILRRVIDDGKGIEVNTSSRRLGSKTCPLPGKSSSCTGRWAGQFSPSAATVTRGSTWEPV